MELQNTDAFLVNRSFGPSDTLYQESWQNILSEVDADLGLSGVTDNLSDIRSATGTGGEVISADITNSGGGYLNGTYTDPADNATISTNGNGTGLVLASHTITNGFLSAFEIDPANRGTGYVENEMVMHDTTNGNKWYLLITKVGDNGIPLSALYAPLDMTTLPDLP